MKVKNTINNKINQDVVATMAIEEMYFSKEFLEEVMRVDNGEKTIEELRQEIIAKHAR